MTVLESTPEKFRDAVSIVRPRASVADCAYAPDGGTVLVITLRRLEPDIGSGSPLAVLVDLDASLVDLPSGETRWYATWPARAVRTGGSGSVLDASRRATREVFTELFAWLSPITPPARDPVPEPGDPGSP